MELPKEIAAILGVDFSGNVVSLDASSFGASRTPSAASPTTTTTTPTRVARPTSTVSSAGTSLYNTYNQVTNEIIQQTILAITADPNYIPFVNDSQDGLVNSPLYVSGVSIGLNTIAPTHMLDVNQGNINIIAAAGSTYGYKINSHNIAYTDPSTNRIILGETYNATIGNLDLFTIELNRIHFDTAASLSEGMMSWNDADGTVDLTLKGGNVTLQVGQEEVIRIVNKTGATLNEADFRVVRVRSVAEGGAQGQRLAVVLAQADSDANSATTIGIVTETIANNAEGFITISGNVSEIDTTGAKSYGGLETWADGDILYLSPTHAGYLTNVKPVSPEHMVIIGWVVYSHSNHGKIFVKVDNGYEIDELHNVLITNVQNNQALIYKTSNNTWQNKPLINTQYYIPVSDGDSFIDSIVRTSTDGTKIGVGVTPSYKFDVAGDINISSGSLYRIGGAQLSTTYVLEGTNLYFTEDRVRATLLTGLTITGNAIVATDSVLQAFGKLQNQINGLVGGVTYQGAWNASTNSPTITSSTGTKGYYYVVTVAGATSIDGQSDWKVGDWIIFDGSTWSKVDNTESVVSVNTKTGAVVLNTDDISETVTPTNKWYTDARARAAISESAPITYNSTSGAIGITQASSTTDGYLSSTDWNTFNNKQSAITNAITGSLTSGYIPKATGSTTLGNSIIYENATGIGIGMTPSYKLDVNGDSRFLNTINVWQNNYTFPAITPSYFGYSTSYNVVILGNSNSAQTRSLAFNVDVSGNPSGAFAGYGNEYIWRNAGSFITPNSSNNGYNTLFSWNSSGQLTFNNSATFSSSVTAGGAITISGNGNGLNFTGGNNRIYFNSYRALEGSTDGATLQIGEGYGKTLLQGGNVGIGTTSIGTKLTVNNGGASTSTNYQSKNISVNSGFITGYSAGTIQSLLAGYDATTVHATDIGYFYDGTGYGLSFSTNPSYPSGAMTERMRITSGGNVVMGDGTQSIASDATLTIRRGNSFGGIDIKSARTSGNIGGLRWYDSTDTLKSQLLVETDGQLVFYNQTSSPRLTIASSGNVTINEKLGIGTSPNQKLEIRNSAGSDAFALITGGAGGTKGGLYLGNDGTQYGSLWFDNATNDVVLRQNYVNGNLIFGTASTERMRITSGGLVEVNSAHNSALSFRVYYDMEVFNTINFTDASYYNQSSIYGANAGLYFRVNNSNTTAMNINYSGNVTINEKLGIGTSNPEQKLHVEGTIQLGNQNDLAWAYDNGNYYNYITNFYNTTDGMVFRSGLWTGNQSIITHSFETYSGGWQKRLVISQEGNVGINQSPNSWANLSVNGRLAISGSGYVTNPSQMVLGQYTSTIGYIQMPSAGQLDIWNGGTGAVATFYNNGNVYVNNNLGIGTTPSYKLDVAGDINFTGNLYKNGVLFSAGGGTVSGTVGYIPKFTATDTIGNSSMQEFTSSIYIAKGLEVNGGELTLSQTSASSTSYIIQAWTNNGTTTSKLGFTLRNNGQISTGTQVSSPTNQYTASAANMYIDSLGYLYKSGSSLKYKTNVVDYDKGLAEVMAISPKYYNGINDGQTLFAGLIAEQIHELGMSEFVQYAQDGTPDGLAYTHMIALLVNAIKELKAKIDFLENK